MSRPGSSLSYPYPPLPSSPPSSVPPYCVLRVLSVGSHCSAFLCERRGAAERVVIKQIKIQQANNNNERDIVKAEKAKIRLLSEVRILVKCGLWHPNICRLHSYQLGGPSPFPDRSSDPLSCDHFYLFLFYYRGGDLHQWIKRRKRAGRHFSEKQIIDCFIQICLGVRYLHDNRILHRDLKASNIFIDPQPNWRTIHNSNDGQANASNEEEEFDTDESDFILKIGDFGISHLFEDDEAFDLCRTRIGTPYYLSPEICQGRTYSYSSDVWALGVILSELCLMKHAFQGATLAALVEAITAGNYTRIRYRPPSSTAVHRPAHDGRDGVYSYGVYSLIGRLLSPRPHERPTVAEILDMNIIQERMKQVIEEEKQEKQREVNSGPTAMSSLNSAAPPQPPVKQRQQNKGNNNTIMAKASNDPVTASRGGRVPSIAQPGGAAAALIPGLGVAGLRYSPLAVHTPAATRSHFTAHRPAPAPLPSSPPDASTGRVAAPIPFSSSTSSLLSRASDRAHGAIEAARRVDRAARWLHEQTTEETDTATQAQYPLAGPSSSSLPIASTATALLPDPLLYSSSFPIPASLIAPLDRYFLPSDRERMKQQMKDILRQYKRKDEGKAKPVDQGNDHNIIVSNPASVPDTAYAASPAPAVDVPDAAPVLNEAPAFVFHLLSAAPSTASPPSARTPTRIAHAEAQSPPGPLPAPSAASLQSGPGPGPPSLPSPPRLHAARQPALPSGPILAALRVYVAALHDELLWRFESPQDFLVHYELVKRILDKTRRTAAINPAGPTSSPGRRHAESGGEWPASLPLSVLQEAQRFFEPSEWPLIPLFHDYITCQTAIAEAEEDGAEQGGRAHYEERSEG